MIRAIFANPTRTLAAMKDSTYGQDTFAPPGTPPLTAFHANYMPSPSPPPPITHTNCNKNGGAALVIYLDNGRDPDIAREAARDSLPSDEDPPDEEPRRERAVDGNTKGGSLLQPPIDSPSGPRPILRKRVPLPDGPRRRPHVEVPATVGGTKETRRSTFGELRDLSPKRPSEQDPSPSPPPDGYRTLSPHSASEYSSSNAGEPPNTDHSASTPVTSTSINSTSTTDRMSLDGISHPQPVSGSYTFHDSPGYVCPFCPDREHKYPRPDTLQRHVRIHHSDKKKDNPQLRDVLAQRPGGSHQMRKIRGPPSSTLLIRLLDVMNISVKDSGGRFVVSYDAGQTIIAWDFMTGDENSQFACYDQLTVVAWMKDGNVAFGDTKGSIIMFEPSTSEHVSSRTIGQIAVTTLAPSADCRTFAIGSQNGSLFVATLQPRFTILHNLTTSRGPSPIVDLAWHASSSRQKSDMLAVLMRDGDLRVWSVAKKYSADDPAKVVRNLRKAEISMNGPKWMGWSKNGRIIQYSDSQTQSWDVRAKDVTHDPIPTLDLVHGLAVYGPGATLFTLGPNNTVQQFDLNSPAIVVANVQHPANLLPPSPPVSEETGDRSVTSATTIASESETSSIPLYLNISESEEDRLSPFARLTRRQAYDSGNEPYESASPVSSRSGLSSLSKSSAGSSQTPGHYPGSMRSRGLSENTYISAGTSIRSSTIGNSAHGNTRDLYTYSMGYSLDTTSVPSIASSGSRSRPSRLRNEVPRSLTTTSARLTNDDLRRQLLNTIFGWNKEVEDLIRDEMSRHPQGSPSRILLAKWLGDIDPNIMNANFENMTSSDWMLLALSGIGGHTSQQKLGHTYVQCLLETGDVHTAVTIILGMGDHNDAIEVYISHKRYMEALILTCLSAPSQLAIRCLAYTDQEFTEPWASPSAAQLNFQAMTPSIPEVLSPPLSHRGPQRSIAKISALKLITSFGDQIQKSKFFAADGGQTPLAAGVTPIAESAGSPAFSHASNNQATTAFLRTSNNSRFNIPFSARGRGHLPSIGEIPSDLNRDALRSAVLSAVPYDYAPRSVHARTLSGNDNMTMGTALQCAATASPMMMREHAQRVVQP
ncbi:hypothetical protein FOXB_17312, partial [Fusarium oxysporum f. sp. conglutinans Fo5176]